MRTLFLSLALLMAATATHADVLLLQAIKAAPPNSESGVLRPRSGMRMAQVLTDYGNPESVKEAVGDPPITRWIYPAYTVYFEHEYVIDVVVHR